MLRVVIAGASGFVGRHLIDKLRSDHQIIALSRSAKVSDSPNIEWRQCDLFSLLQTEEAVRGADVGIFLVHSMMPNSRLTQGSFQDIDLIASDNFARAAKKMGLKQIVYLGGLVEDSKQLSRHLESRLEVEKVLATYGVATTSLRAGLIIGQDGSSFRMLCRLVVRLPVMVLPSWTANKTQVSNIDEVITIIAHVLNKPDFFNDSYDLGSEEVMAYEEMIKRLARYLGLKRFFIRFPLVSPGISKLWVSLVTQTPYALVSPLVESLRHPMTCKDRRIYEKTGVKSLSFQESIERAFARKDKKIPKLQRKVVQVDERNTVRSVQRMPCPQGLSGMEAGELYFKWASKAFWGIISIRGRGSDIDFLAFFLPGVSLLRLRLDGERSTKDRALYRITGGLLAAKNQTGRFEFREVLGGKFLIIAIHEFVPALPWFIYNMTQAIVHLWVMKRFSNYLKRLLKKGEQDGSQNREHTSRGSQDTADTGVQTKSTA